jgi:signal transduction histidine kinase
MILIVDDRKENILSLKSILELHKFEVDTANSGEEALKKILRTDYELVILDVQMPGMDGFEVAEAISGYSKSKDIPIIFLTAVSIDKRFITKGYKSGGIDYVTKPFDPDILLLKVKTFSRLHDQNKKLNEIQQELRQEIEFRKDAEQQLNAMNQSLEQKIAERTENLVNANDELAKKNLELQQFAYIASHDLKEPLRKIQIFGNLIKDRMIAPTDKNAMYVQKVIHSADRMSTLVNDVLAYSAIDIPKKFETIDLNKIVRDILSDFEILIEEKNATISKDNLPVVDMIPVQARQLLQNLIANAIKFSKEGVAPLISVNADLLAKMEWGAPAVDHDKALYCRISVQDNGIGFDNEYSHKIFSIFQRLHSSDAFEGTGIGLAIAKKIADTHKGFIMAESQLGKGSKFSVLLPLQQNDSSDNQTNA